MSALGAAAIAADGATAAAVAVSMVAAANSNAIDFMNGSSPVLIGQLLGAECSIRQTRVCASHQVKRCHRCRRRHATCAENQALALAEKAPQAKAAGEWR